MKRGCVFSCNQQQLRNSNTCERIGEDASLAFVCKMYDFFLFISTSDFMNNISQSINHLLTSLHSKPSSNAGDKFLESGAFGESALDELNIVWD
jgi:hypothetical protein